MPGLDALASRSVTPESPPRTHARRNYYCAYVALAQRDTAPPVPLRFRVECAASLLERAVGGVRRRNPVLRKDCGNRAADLRWVQRMW